MIDVKLFSGSASQNLADKIADFHGQSLGQLSIQRFSDGEICPNIKESVRGAYVFFIQSTYPPADNILELLLMIDAAKRASAGYITAVIPYFGYARQDRKDKPRVSIGSKMIANLLESAGANRVMTMDLHADQIQGFFNIPVDHLKSEAIFIPFIKNINLDNIAFASPDVGGVKRARTYAKHFKADLVICDKHREKANQVAGMTIIGDVKDKNIILVDDLIDTAGTLTKAANLIMEKGAKSVRAMCTHPVLSGEAYERIENSQLEELVICDTKPLDPVRSKLTNKITVLSTAKLFSRAIRNTYENRSISALFASETS